MFRRVGIKDPGDVLKCVGQISSLRYFLNTYDTASKCLGHSRAQDRHSPHTFGADILEGNWSLNKQIMSC